MQVQKINHTPQAKPAFGANLVYRATDAAVGSAKKTVVNIYSVSSKDKTFLERILNVIGGQSFSEDCKLISSDGDVKNTIKRALNKAINLDYDTNYQDRVLISVEDNKNITGVMSIGENADVNVEDMAVWGGKKKSTSRKALLLSALNTTATRKLELEIPLNRLTAAGENYFKNLGFLKDSKFKDLYIPSEQIEARTQKIKDKSLADYKFMRCAMMDKTDLNKIFSIDA